MAHLSTNKDGGVIRWDSADWLTGLIPNHTTSRDTANRLITANKGLSFSSGADPFRMLNAISPGLTSDDLTNVSAVDSAQLSGVTDGSNIYTIGGTKLHKSSSSTVTNSGAWPHTINNGGASYAESGLDVKFYNGKLYYKFTKVGGGGDVGEYDLASTFNDDFFSTATGSSSITSSDYQPMVVGDDDVLYVPDGNILKYWDGTTTGTALTLPTNFVITAFSKVKDFLVIYAFKKVGATAYAGAGADYKTECITYWWDYVSADPTYKYALPGNTVTAAFNDFLGTHGCFVVGQSNDRRSGTTTKILVFDGNQYKPIFTTPYPSPLFGGVETSVDSLYWLTSGSSGVKGKILHFGSPYPGMDKALSCIALGAGEGAGMLRNFSGSLFYFSTGPTTTGGLQKTSNNYFQTAQFTIPCFPLSFPRGYKARLESIVINWAATSETNCATIAIDLNINKNAVLANLVSSNSVSSGGLVKEITTDLSGVTLGKHKFDSIGFDVNYSAGSDATKRPPIIQSIEAYFSWEKYTP